jgi:2-polyprenyl-6-methoxyphenol hydroxylase-like FAD-dependent oxidoreductase
MAVSRSGYCGLVRLADGGIDLAAAVDRAALAGPTGPGGAVWSILNEAEGDIGRLRMSEQAIRTAEFRATPPLTHASALVAGATGRMLRAGDAAAYVEPFTGEGIGWALTSGRIVADAVLARSPQGSATLCSPIEVATRYRVDHRQHFQPLHDRCRRVSIALRRPAVVAAAMHAARIAPWAARRLMPALIGSHVAEASCS